MSQTFSKTLKKIRVEKGLSQQGLANKLYVTRPTVARWENGSRLPDAIMISKLAEVLGVDVSLFLSVAAQGDEKINVIIVDDRKLILSGGIKVLKEALPEANINGFTDASEAITFAKSNRVSLAFLDIELRSTTGFELCKEILKIYPRTNVIFLTAYSAYSLDAWSTGASGFMVKPITKDGIKEQLQKLRYPFLIGDKSV